MPFTRKKRRNREKNEKFGRDRTKKCAKWPEMVRFGAARGQASPGRETKKAGG
jgi:hypothetical protein